MHFPSATIVPSILDRLIDASVGTTAPVVWYDMEQLLASVQRDVEELLNTRQTHRGLCDDMAEVQRSIVAYGLPDPASLDPSTPQTREAIGLILEDAVRKFEPRLKNVRATLAAPLDHLHRTLHFRIEAQLTIDDATSVAFDTTLDMSTGKYSLELSQS